jgi:hypothetical protein
VADATVRGGLARFINHSCNPNCFTKAFYVNGVPHMGIYAKRPIELGEELAYDYKVRRVTNCLGVPSLCFASWQLLCVLGMLRRFLVNADMLARVAVCD